MRKNILFLTTHNLATNPRLVKEMRLALQNGFEVTVICFEFDNWSSRINDRLIDEFPEIQFILIPAGRKPFLPWAWSAGLECILRGIGRYMSLSGNALATAVSRRHVLLMAAFKKIKTADWVIGHNPGAMAATLMASEYFKCRCGFDVEDYHPGEGSDQQLNRLTLLLMRKHVPLFDYVSFASGSILDETRKKIPSLDASRVMIVPNSFPVSEFRYDSGKNDNRLHLVWFSQHVDAGRGLEHIIPIVDKHHDKMDLTVFGQVAASFRQRFVSCDSILWENPLPQKDLHLLLSQYDAGLAIEPGKDLNNELALSNKMLAYYQSGLYIIATRTVEQERFMLANPAAGCLLGKNFSDAETVLLDLYENIPRIRSGRENRINAGKSVSWEENCQKLSVRWNQ